GEVLDVVVGKPAAALIITDERVRAAQLAQPVLPDRTLPVVLEVRQPVCRPDERRTLAAQRVPDAYAVARAAETDALLLALRSRCRRGRGLSRAADRERLVRAGAGALDGPDVADEAKAAAADGADHLLRIAIVVQ